MIKMSNTSRKGHAIFTLCDMTYFLVVLLAVMSSKDYVLFPITQQHATHRTQGKVHVYELEVILHGMTRKPS